ncbi:MAG: FHA domain-containing protein [Alphaproteobacteria bacterium]|nr:FHA domain-containing protein [Alphaproteobacteria bacterium]
MAIIRGPDGKPIGEGDEGNEATTRRVEKRSIKERVASSGAGDAGPTQVSNAESLDKTDPVPQQAASAPNGSGGGASAGGGGAAGGGGGGGSSDDAPKTQIVGARRRSEEKAEPTGNAPGSTTLSDPMEDPVVGWVVVVDGPGQGASLTLGYGMNSIGRAPTERICLDFGDSQISRTSHASITYDPRGKKYFINHGGGKNLTYLGEDPVLTPIQLKGGEEVMIGDTTLRFVPFCGEDFDWRDQ